MPLSETLAVCHLVTPDEPGPEVLCGCWSHLDTDTRVVLCMVCVGTGVLDK